MLWGLIRRERNTRNQDFATHKEAKALCNRNHRKLVRAGGGTRKLRHVGLPAIAAGCERKYLRCINKRAPTAVRIVFCYSSSVRFSVSTITLCFAAALGAGAAYSQGREDGQWAMPGKDYAGTRYSDLAQIMAANVGQLKPAWCFPPESLAGTKANPW